MRAKPFSFRVEVAALLRKTALGLSAPLVLLPVPEKLKTSFSCGLFKDAVNNLDCSLSIGGMIDVLESSWDGPVAATSRCHRGT
jgi:hypothetical protein